MLSFVVVTRLKKIPLSTRAIVKVMSLLQNSSNLDDKWGKRLLPFNPRTCDLECVAWKEYARSLQLQLHCKLAYHHHLASEALVCKLNQWGDAHCGSTLACVQLRELDFLEVLVHISIWKAFQSTLVHLAREDATFTFERRMRCFKYTRLKSMQLTNGYNLCL